MLEFMKPAMHLALVIALSVPASAQTTWYVDDVGGGPGSGTSSDPYTSITYALAQQNVTSGDTVIVRAGTFVDEAIDFLGKNVALLGQGPEFTTIVAMPEAGPVSHSVVRFTSGEGSTAVLRGFTITGGSGVSGCADAFCEAGGGGVLCIGASPTIENCRFTGNTTYQRGGGVYAESSRIRIYGCTFDDNHACEGSGIALRNCDAVIEGCVIVPGAGSSGLNEGGALYAVDSDLAVTDCLVEGFSVSDHVAGLSLRSCNSSIVDSMFLSNDSIGAGGGALFVSAGSCTILACRFENNSASFEGGAAFISASSAEVRDSFFLDNWAGLSDGHQGGAMYVTGGSLVVERTEFSRNRSAAGGALHVSSVADVVDCGFFDNEAVGHPKRFGLGGAIEARGFLVVERGVFERNHAGGFFDTPGGAIAALTADSVDISDSVFVGNSAKQGGAIALGALSIGPVACIERSLFLDNGASGALGSMDLPTRGGALSVSSASTVEVATCLFAGNAVSGPTANGAGDGDGGAVFGDVQIEGCTVVDNVAFAVGGGLQAGSATGCIVRDNEPDNLDAGAVATFSNIEGGWAGIGNIDAPALFVDASNRNYHLGPGSPCIDTGDPSSQLDLDGSIADMGAFQFVDCNDNGIVDAIDIAMASSVDQNGNGFPDECECLVYNYCQASQHSVGSGATMGAAGTTSVSQNDLVLVANTCPPNMNGIFFYGTAQHQAPFGDGSRCVFGQVFRLTTVNSGPQGSATFAMDYNDPPQASGQITAGSRWNFQFWFRDPTGPGGSGFNLSDGLEVVFCP